MRDGFEVLSNYTVEDDVNLNLFHKLKFINETTNQTIIPDQWKVYTSI